MPENNDRIYIEVRPGVYRGLRPGDLTKIQQEQIEKKEFQRKSYLGGTAPGVHFNFTTPYSYNGKTYTSAKNYEKAVERDGGVLASKEEGISIAEKNKLAISHKNEKEIESELRDVAEDFRLSNKILEGD